jgi:hypothetical protein
MVYNTQNYWVIGLCPSPSILETRRPPSSGIVETRRLVVSRTPDNGQSLKTQ